MAGRIRLELDYEAIARLTEDAIEQKTQEIAARAGDGYAGDVIWTDRPHGAVRATTYEARVDNARNNTLLKAAQGG
jgi:hypothetical protein